MKIDLYKHEQKYLNWKQEAIKKDYIESDLSKQNSKVLIQYIFDMEIGANVSLKNKKGARSFARLNNSRQKLAQMFRMFQDRKINDITKISEKQIQEYFNDMRNGIIKTQQGAKYKATADYVKIFKAFWHWHIKVERKNKNFVDDLTIELDSSRDEKPKWVYLDDEQIKTILNKCEARYKPLLSFQYDSGARVTETFSILVEDIHIEKGIVYVDLKEENSKTFGRKIKLLLCGKDLLEYIKRTELKPSDRLFNFSPDYTNRYLGQLGEELFGKGNSKAGAKYSDLSMYDFRHCSACYWVQRYKNNSALMYRFGWKTEKYILYYTEFLGMRDLIQQEDLYIDITKTELEKEMQQLKEKFNKSEEEKEKNMEFIFNVLGFDEKYLDKSMDEATAKWNKTKGKNFQEKLINFNGGK